MRHTISPPPPNRFKFIQHLLSIGNLGFHLFKMRGRFPFPLGYRGVLSICFLSLYLVSCNTHDQVLTQEQDELKLSQNLRKKESKPKFKVVDGIAQFKDKEEIGLVLESICLDSMYRENVIEYTKSLGLNSLHKYYSEGPSQESIVTSGQIPQQYILLDIEDSLGLAKELEYSIPEEPLQLLLNEEMQLKIGKELITFSYYEMIVDDGNTKKTKKVERSRNKGRNLRGIQWLENTNHYSYGGKDYKVTLESRSFGNYSGYFSLSYLVAKHQKRTLGVWHKVETEYMGLQFWAEVFDPYAYPNNQNYYYSSECLWCTYRDKAMVYKGGYYLGIRQIQLYGTFRTLDGVLRTLYIYDNQ